MFLTILGLILLIAQISICIIVDWKDYLKSLGIAAIFIALIILTK